MDIQDAALGSLLGACCGDAAGATLELMGRQPTLSGILHRFDSQSLNRIENQFAAIDIKAE